MTTAGARCIVLLFGGDHGAPEVAILTFVGDYGGGPEVAILTFRGDYCGPELAISTLGRDPETVI